jgi:nucleoside-diphosphate kinase
MEQTFAIIKPDAVQKNLNDLILERIQKEGFEILQMKKIKMSVEQAAQFYEMHNKRSFFNELVDFMTSGEVVVMVLEKENAILEWRKLMGETDPKNASPNTLRKLYGSDVGKNAVHGSDSLINAQREIKLFFE